MSSNLWLLLTEGCFRSLLEAWKLPLLRVLKYEANVKILKLLEGLEMKTNCSSVYQNNFHGRGGLSGQLVCWWFWFCYVHIRSTEPGPSHIWIVWLVLVLCLPHKFLIIWLHTQNAHVGESKYRSGWCEYLVCLAMTALIAVNVFAFFPLKEISFWSALH